MSIVQVSFYFLYHQFRILKDKLTLDIRQVKVLKIFMFIQGYIGDTMLFLQISSGYNNWY